MLYPSPTTFDATVMNDWVETNGSALFQCMKFLVHLQPDVFKHCYPVLNQTVFVPEDFKEQLSKCMENLDLTEEQGQHLDNAVTQFIEYWEHWRKFKENIKHCVQQVKKFENFLRSQPADPLPKGLRMQKLKDAITQQKLDMKDLRVTNNQNSTEITKLNAQIKQLHLTLNAAATQLAEYKQQPLPEIVNKLKSISAQQLEIQRFSDAALSAAAQKLGENKMKCPSVYMDMFKNAANNYTKHVQSIHHTCTRLQREKIQLGEMIKDLEAEPRIKDLEAEPSSPVTKKRRV